MPDAIWMLAYDIPEDEQDTYLDWFHGIHIPEKLARPGYTWAAHFKSPATSEKLAMAGGSGFIAMFGGKSTRVFLDPSPAQLKLQQDAQTRSMMALRQSGFAMVLAHEWSASQTSTDEPLASPMHCPNIQLLCADSTGNDEQVGAWCAQELAATLLAVNHSQRVSKFANVVSGARHALVHELARSQSMSDFTGRSGELGRSLEASLNLIIRTGSRIWPEPAC